MQRYEHSGIIPVVGLGWTILVGLVTAVVLSVVYTFAIAFIPFIYINFAATLFLGFAIGGAVGWGAKVGKIRHRTTIALIGLCFGCLGLYVAWATDPLARVGLSDGLLALEPGVLWQYMMWCYENGTWGFTDDSLITGNLLAAIWLAEALLVLVVAALISQFFVATRPFCERCDQWTAIEKNVQRLLLTCGDDELLEGLAANGIHALNEIDLAHAEQQRFVRLDLARCPSCSNSNFLIVQKVQRKLDQDGNTETDEEPMATYEISPQDAEHVRALGLIAECA